MTAMIAFQLECKTAACLDPRIVMASMLARQISYPQKYMEMGEERVHLKELKKVLRLHEEMDVMRDLMSVQLDELYYLFKICRDV